MIRFVKNLVKRYFSGGFWLFFPQGVALLITLITLPIILENLNPGDYGQLQFVFAIQVWLTSFSISYAVTGAKRGISRGLNGTFLFAFFSQFKFLLVIGLAGFAAALFIFHLGFATIAFLLAIVSGFLIVGYTAQTSYPEFFIAKKQFKNYALWQSGAFIIISFGSAISAVLSGNIFIFSFVQLGLTAVISLAAVAYIIIKNKIVASYKKGEIDKTCFSYGVKLIPAGFINTSSNKLSSFIIGPFFGFANLAVFSVSSKINEKFGTLTKLLHNLFYADFAGWNQAGLIQRIKLRSKQLFIVSFSAALAAALLGYVYISLFLPSSYGPAKIYFLILALGLPAVILQIIPDTILSANLRHKELNFLIILTNLIRIGLIIILGLFLKIIGICLALALSAWISFAFYYYLTVKKH